MFAFPGVLAFIINSIYDYKTSKGIPPEYDILHNMVTALYLPFVLIIMLYAYNILSFITETSVSGTPWYGKDLIITKIRIISELMLLSILLKSFLVLIIEHQILNIIKYLVFPIILIVSVTLAFNGLSSFLFMVIICTYLTYTVISTCIPWTYFCINQKLAKTIRYTGLIGFFILLFFINGLLRTNGPGVGIAETSEQTKIRKYNECEVPDLFRASCKSNLNDIKDEIE
jgi:hypothetical protein